MGFAHDVILGKPWFAKCQPQLDWRSHELSFPHQCGPLTCTTRDKRNQIDMEIAVVDFKRKVKKHEYDEVYRVKICAIMTKSDTIPQSITTLLNEFKDVFPETLPDGLPPSRRVGFDLFMKLDAVPSNSAPFRLFKVEQDALDMFVVEKLKKGWIEISDSPWVLNIFGVPKKDPITGQNISRSEWVRSDNAHLPLR